MADGAYLDCNATMPLRPDARAAALAALDAGGNASSVHGRGRAARASVEEAREAVAALAGAGPGDVVFTSGATEANALALAQAGEGPVVASAVEHPSILAGASDGDEVEQIPVDGNGVIDLAWLARRLEAAPRPRLVSVMVANNETGVLEPVAEAAELARAAGVTVHADAVQAAGRLPLDLGALGADMISVSSHKIGGPQGAGALVRRPGFELRALIRGGGQEGRRRAGTENVPAIAGFGAASRLTRAETGPRAAEIAALRDWFESEISTICPEVTIFGEDAARLPNTSCFAVPGIVAETAVIALDLEGIAVSSGSACSSGKVGPSHVLAAMGVADDLAAGAIRVSLGWATGRSELEAFVSVWRRVVSRSRGRRGARPQAA